MTMKKHSKFEFILDNIFFGQGKEKVYIFKMLTKGPRSRPSEAYATQRGFVECMVDV